MTHAAPSLPAHPPHRRRRTILRRCTLVVLLLAAVAAALVFFRTAIINRLAPLVLSRAGLGDLAIHVREISGTRVRIDSVSGLVPVSGRPLRVQLERLEYDFTYRQLFTGKLEHLRIARAELGLPAWKEAATDKKGPPADLGLAFEQALRLVHSLRLPALDARIDSLVLRGELQGKPLSTPPMRLDYSGSEAEGRLRMQQIAPKEETAPLVLQLQWAKGELRGEARLQVASLSAWLPLALPLRQGQMTLQVHLPKDGEKTPAARCSLQGSDMAGQGWRAASLQLDLEAEAENGTDAKALLLQEGSRLQVRGLQLEGGGQLRLAQGDVPLQGHIHRRQAGGWQLEWRPTSPVHLDGLRTATLSLVPLTFQGVVLRLDHKAAGSDLRADLRLAELGGRFHLQWTRADAGTHKPARQQLTLKTAEPLQLHAENSPLRLLAKPSPSFLTGVQVEQGQLQAGLQLHWGASPLTARLDLDMRDGTLRHGGIRYSGIGLRQQVQLLPQLASAPGTLSVATIQGPFLLEQLVATLRLQAPDRTGGTPALVVQDATVRVFDGLLTGENCRYVPGGSGETCTLSVRNLDLAAILALHQVKGLSVSGRVDGRLPVRFAKTGLSVSGGELHSTGTGGVIRYQPPNEALKQSAYSEYTLRVLEDYHYHSLAATLDYQPDGTLVAGLRLQGRNPQMETQRPVHLNLRAEQNVLSLLRSLQYSQGLTSELQQKVQERLQSGQRQ